MTSQETTTPSAEAETAPQISGDDPFDIGNIPTFLRRTPKPVALARATWPPGKGN